MAINKLALITKIMRRELDEVKTELARKREEEGWKDEEDSDND